MDSSARKPLFVFLLLLLATDVGLIGLHVVYVLRDGPPGSAHSLEYRWGYGEFFQHLKELWLVLLVALCALRTRKSGYFAWTLLFAYLLLDDKYKIHGHVGDWVANALSLSGILGARACDAGELLVSAVAGCLLLGLVLVTTLRADLAFRQFSLRLFCMLLVLAFFGVFVDLLHEMIHIPSLHTLCGGIEEGGEMLTLSAIVAYVLVHDPTAITAEPPPQQLPVRLTGRASLWHQDLRAQR